MEGRAGKERLLEGNQAPKCHLFLGGNPSIYRLIFIFLYIFFRRLGAKPDYFLPLEGQVRVRDELESRPHAEAQQGWCLGVGWEATAGAGQTPRNRIYTACAL